MVMYVEFQLYTGNSIRYMLWYNYKAMDIYACFRTFGLTMFYVDYSVTWLCGSWFLAEFVPLS